MVWNGEEKNQTTKTNSVHTLVQSKIQCLCLPKHAMLVMLALQLNYRFPQRHNCPWLQKLCLVMVACNLREAAAFEFSVEEKPWISDSLFSTYALLFQVTAKTTKTRHPCELPTQFPLPVVSTTLRWRSSAKGGMGKCYTVRLELLSGLTEETKQSNWAERCVHAVF